MRDEPYARDKARLPDAWRDALSPSFNNKPEHGGVRVIVSVDASIDDIEKMPASKTAGILGVSPARIAAMIDSGLLDGWKDGPNRWDHQGER